MKTAAAALALGAFSALGFAPHLIAPAAGAEPVTPPPEPTHVPLDPPADIGFHLAPLSPGVMPEPGVHGGWGQGVFAPDGRFLYAIGNHLTAPEADAWLIAFDPKTGTHERLFASRDAAGWGRGENSEELGDGKLHTAIDVRPDGMTYLLSFYGDYPRKSDWAEHGGNYPGGRLFRHDLTTGQTESLGVPLPNDSWPMQRWDHSRGKLVGVGERGLYLHPDLADDQAPDGWEWEGPNHEHSYGSVLVYDTSTHKVLFAGLPDEHLDETPEPIRFERRSLVLCPETGRFFGSTPGTPSRALLIEPNAASPEAMFRRLPLQTDAPLRGSTRRLTPDGELIVVSRAGTLYGLKADTLELREIGTAWNEGTWLTDLSLDPTGRFLYYVVDSTWTGTAFDVPVVRYDLKTQERKVLVRLSDALFKQHGYIPVGTYTNVVTPDGRHLVTQVNGSFGTHRDAHPKYAQPAIVTIELPQP